MQTHLLNENKQTKSLKIPIKKPIEKKHSLSLQANHNNNFIIQQVCRTYRFFGLQCNSSLDQVLA